MPIPHFSETTLRRQATVKSFERGEDYYQSGAVGRLQRRGNTLQTEVEGSAVEPYMVCLTFDDSSVTDADCSCPYDFGGWCKHIVATALACLREPESLEERPTLEALLERLDLPQARDLVKELLAEQPRLMEVVDDYVQRLAEPAPSPQPATPTRRTLVDPASYRRARCGRFCTARCGTGNRAGTTIRSKMTCKP